MTSAGVAVRASLLFFKLTFFLTAQVNSGEPPKSSGVAKADEALGGVMGLPPAISANCQAVEFEASADDVAKAPEVSHVMPRVVARGQSMISYMCRMPVLRVEIERRAWLLARCFLVDSVDC